MRFKNVTCLSRCIRVGTATIIIPVGKSRGVLVAVDRTHY